MPALNIRGESMPRRRSTWFGRGVKVEGLDPVT
jgi:hypothetical protein